MITQIRNLGNKGEDIAVKYLKKQSYEILDRNFGIRTGEIDIVAKENGQIVFVEVKTRSDRDPDYLDLAVNRSKQRRIMKAASYYLDKNDYNNLIARFDVIFVIKEHGNIKIEHITDAFEV